MSEQVDTRQLILDSAQKIFSDHCDKKLLDQAETGQFPDTLWQVVRENGFDQLGSYATGTDWNDLFAFVQTCGRFAVPLPMTETLLANQWAGAGGLSSIGEIIDGQIVSVPWGRSVSRVVGIEADTREVVVVESPQVVHQGSNMAGEPNDIIAIPDNAQKIEVPQDPYALSALGRINLMAGCLQTVLDLGIQFATERTQFGRSISKFQAIQHSLAVVAAEVAAALRAADAAVDAVSSDRFLDEVAASKARVGEAVGVVAEQVHQIHGAMGFTHEHQLHHYTRRAWAWRDEWGNEFYWQARLGMALAQLGADNVWDFIATRG
ncbi:MAG: acyl-CoA dehydrogenase family protein [Pseudomonadota bacterium]